MKHFNIGMIGIGQIGREHLERISKKTKNADVVCCSDANPEYGREIAGKLGLTYIESEEELINSPEVDGVFIAAADQDHERYAIAAIKAGKYVLMEKPLAVDDAACRRIMDAETAAGKRYVTVAFMRRFDPYYRQLKDALDTCGYGEPLVMHCIHRNYHAIYSHGPESTIENSFVHEMDMARFLLGEDVVSVQIKLPKCSSYTKDRFPDPQLLYMETESGVVIDVEGFITTETAYQIGCEICCERGILKLAQPSEALLSSKGSTSFKLDQEWIDRFEDAYTIEIQEWVNASMAGDQRGPNSWDGYISSKVSTAAKKSLKTGEKIILEKEEVPELYR